ncbi:hypothetical protein MRY87_06380 [bacterium]|nr:hypothetical protein [bacterium]
MKKVLPCPRKVLVLILVFLSLGAFTGCGGGSAGTGIYSSGLDTERPLKTLTDDEHVKLCRSIAEQTLRIVQEESFCTFFGVISETVFSGGFQFGDEMSEETPLESSVEDDFSLLCEDVQSSCQEGFSDLVSQQSDEEIVMSCTVSPVPQLVGCDVSIGELERCIDQDINQFLAISSTFTCDDAGDLDRLETALSELQGVPRSPECLSIEQKCPGVFTESLGF